MVLKVIEERVKGFEKVDDIVTKKLLRYSMFKLVNFKLEEENIVFVNESCVLDED